jgi:hypothetical protein
MTPLAYCAIIAAVSLVALLFVWLLCRVNAPQSVDEGQAFGGDDE